jgi:multimeric flavodoxin WrbA
MSTRIVAVVGSYRKNGTVDAAVEAVLAGARARGAVTQTLYLTEEQLGFCTNCRVCAQTPGEERGKCTQDDALEPILCAIEAADAVVLASPVNYWNVTAIFRRFMERLLGYAYWPWGQVAPKVRSKKKPRKAVLIASAAMPGFLIPLATGAPRALKTTAQMLGARVVGKLWIGFSSGKEHQQLREGVRQRAQRLGEKLV